MVFEFVEQRLPDEYDRVTSFFRKAGACARFKDMLEYKGALQEWYDFENSARQRALKEWCRDNGIEL